MICTLGQAIKTVFVNYFGFTEETASNPTSAVLIFISALITSLGFYDHIAQWAGAGTAVPVTGFANTITSAALEHRTEGYVLGVGGICLKLPDRLLYSAFFQPLL